MDFKGVFVVSKNNVDVRIPLTITYTRMDPSAYQKMIEERDARVAELRQQAEERRAKQEAEAKERAGKPLSAEEKQTILADLNDSSWPKISSRLRALRHFHPHPDDFDIALRVKELRSHKVVGVSLPAKQLWERLEAILEEAGTSTASAPGAAMAARDTSVMRRWSDDSGTFTVQARLQKIDDETVVLTRADGKILNVPLERLSEADRSFIKEYRERVKRTAPTNPLE